MSVIINPTPPATPLAIGGTITGGTAGSVLFINPTATLAQDNTNFNFNDSTFQLSVTGNVVSSGGYSQFSGAYNESSTTAGVYTGIVAGTPRALFANGTAAQNWQIDNDNGTFRWYLPGVTYMTLNTTNLGCNALTVNSSISAQSIFCVNEDYGSMISGTSFLSQLTTTGTANASGSNLRAMLFSAEGNGGNAFGDLLDFELDLYNNTSSGGSVSAMNCASATLWFTGAGTTVNAYGYRTIMVISSGAGTISGYTGLDVRGPSQTGTTNIGTAIGINVENQAGTNTGNAIGIEIQLQSGAGNNYGIYFNSSATTNANGINWNSDTFLYRSGSGALTVTSTITAATGGTFPTLNFTTATGVTSLNCPLITASANMSVNPANVFSGSSSTLTIAGGGWGGLSAGSGANLILKGGNAGGAIGAGNGANITLQGGTAVGGGTTGGIIIYQSDGATINANFTNSGISFNQLTGVLIANGSSVITVKTAPSGAFVGTTDTQTLTNKRITKRTGTTTSSGTPTINTDNVDFYSLTAQAVAITSFTTNLSGTPTEAQTLWIAITDNGTAQTIAWGASFEASTIPLPTTTVMSTRMDVGFVWNTVTSKWRCIATA